jgi:hypothetical protein
MADFISQRRSNRPERRVTGIEQRPTIIKCGFCHRWWTRQTPEEVLETHTRTAHHEVWDEYVGWKADVDELVTLWRLQDTR